MQLFVIFNVFHAYCIELDGILNCTTPMIEYVVETNDVLAKDMQEWKK